MVADTTIDDGYGSSDDYDSNDDMSDGPKLSSEFGSTTDKESEHSLGLYDDLVKRTTTTTTTRLVVTDTSLRIKQGDIIIVAEF